jgi:hypothetical protein
MDRFTLSAGDHGHLICEVSFGAQQATVSCFDLEQGVHDLDLAFHDALRDGVGECYWREATGEYRWVFRKTEPGMVRVALLWSHGAMTGWDQLIWTETDAAAFETRLAEARRGLNAVR